MPGLPRNAMRVVSSRATRRPEIDVSGTPLAYRQAFLTVDPIDALDPR